jgi:WD40 repeat protein
MTTRPDDAKDDRRSFALWVVVAGALAVLACVVIVYLVVQHVRSRWAALDDALVGNWELDREATVQVNPLFRCSPEMIGYEFHKDGSCIRAADGERQSIRWTPLDKEGDDLLFEAAFEGNKDVMRARVVFLDNDHIRLTYAKMGMNYVLKRSAGGRLPVPALVRPLLSLDTGLEGNQLDGGVHALAGSADGRVVVAQGRGRANKVVVWNLAQPQQLHEFPNPFLRDIPVALSANGKVLAYPTGPCESLLDDVKDIVVRDVESGKELHRLKRKDGDIRGLNELAFSPAGDLLMAAAAGDVVGWDLRTGEQRFTWKSDDEGVTALSAFFEGGKKIASGGDGGTVTVWDVATGRAVCTLTGGHDAGVRSIAVTEDGMRLVSAASADLTAPSEPITVWDVAARKVVKRLPARGSTRVALLPDGRTLVYKNVTTVYLENLETGVRGHVLQGHEKFISCLALTPDGSRLVTGSPDQTIKVWDLKALP